MWDALHHEPLWGDRAQQSTEHQRQYYTEDPCHVQQPQFREAAHRSSALTANSVPGFPGEYDDEWVISRQGRQQLFWFRFSINKKSSESNKSCQSGQQQIRSVLIFHYLIKWINLIQYLASSRLKPSPNKLNAHSLTSVYEDKYRPLRMAHIQPGMG